MIINKLPNQNIFSNKTSPKEIISNGNQNTKIIMNIILMIKSSHPSIASSNINTR
jgi:hypothetical protein